MSERSIRTKLRGDLFTPQMIEVGDELVFQYHVIKVLGIGKKAWGRIGLSIELTEGLKPADSRCPGEEKILTQGTNGGVGYSMSADTDKDIMDQCWGLHSIYRNGLQIHPVVEQLSLDDNLLSEAA
jgi:hypothetical protein